MKRSALYVVILLPIIECGFYMEICAGAPFNEDTGHIRGKVTDIKTGAPLAGVNILVEGTRLGAATDASGSYEVKDVSVGVYRLFIQMIGYKVKIVREVKVTENKVSTVDVKLEQTPLELGIVTVTGRREKDMEEQLNTSVRSLRPRDVETLAGGGEDLFRAVQALPGVIARTDLSSQFYVRGGSPDQNLIVVDGVTVFNPDRLKLFGGPISMFNPDVVEYVELIPGGYPAEYGDKLSAILVVNNKEGDHFNYNFKGGVSLIDMKLFAEGPFPGSGENGSWLFSSRRTYYDLFLNNLDELPKGTILPYFRDYQGKIVYDLAPNQKLRLNFTDSNEGMELKDLEVEDGDEDDFFKEGDTFNVSYGVDNRLYSVGWADAFSDVSLSNLTLSTYNDTWFFRIQSNNEFIHPIIDMRKLEMREDYTHILTEYHTMKAGVQIVDYITDISIGMQIDSTEYYEDNPEDRRESDGATVRRSMRFQDASTTTAFYLQDEWKVFPPLLGVLIGMRADNSTFSHEWVYSPRFSFTYLLMPDLVFRGSWGHYYQAPNFVSMFERFEREISWNLFETISLGSEKAVHYLTGIEWQPNQEYTVKLEAYYKALDNLVTLTDSTENNIPKNDGEGFARGFEAFIQKKPSGMSMVSGWLSYSYSETKEKDSKIKLHYRDFDQRHTLNAILRLDLWGGFSFR